MNLKKIILTALLSAVIALPAIATELDSDSTPALQDRDNIQAKQGSSTKSSGDCWIYFPGFGWIFIC